MVTRSALYITIGGKLNHVFYVTFLDISRATNCRIQYKNLCVKEMDLQRKNVALTKCFKACLEKDIFLWRKAHLLMI